jgi:hypothetical protein
VREHLVVDLPGARLGIDVVDRPLRAVSGDQRDDRPGLLGDWLRGHGVLLVESEAASDVFARCLLVER